MTILRQTNTDKNNDPSTPCLPQLAHGLKVIPENPKLFNNQGNCWHRTDLLYKTGDYRVFQSINLITVLVMYLRTRRKSQIPIQN